MAAPTTLDDPRLAAAETFDVKQWRAAGAMNSGRPAVTSWGRKCYIVACRAPEPGELYLKPSGVKGVFNVLACHSEGYKQGRMILRTAGWIGGRALDK